MRKTRIRILSGCIIISLIFYFLMPNGILKKYVNAETELNIEKYYGDGNGNGKLDTEDITLLRGILYDNNIVSEYQKEVFDLNADNKINELDLDLLQQVLDGECVYFPVEEIHYGDINLDNQIDITDLIQITQIIEGIKIPTVKELERADLNGDGLVNGNYNVDEEDKILLREYIQEERGCFPVQNQLERIEIISEPINTKFYAGEKIDTAGIIVEAYYKNGYHREVSNWEFQGNTENLGFNQVWLSYTEAGITERDSYVINVEELVSSSTNSTTSPTVTLSPSPTATSTIIPTPMVTLAPSVDVGQNIQSIKFEGFVSKYDRTNIIDSLPINFAKDTYYLLFNIYDQEGNVIAFDNCTADSIIFLSDNPFLVEGFEFAELFTIKGVTYASVLLRPGIYADIGGEFTVIAIANKTGIKREQLFVVGVSPTPTVIPQIVTPSPSPTVTPSPDLTACPTIMPTLPTPVVTQEPAVDVGEDLDWDNGGEKEAQKIYADSITVTYGIKPFYLDASSDICSPLKYFVANSKVAKIASSGKVTIRGYGKTKVTIRAAATQGYKSAKKNITITVLPKEPTLLEVSTPMKRQLSCSWTKGKSVTGYQIDVSTNRSFKKGTIRRSVKGKLNSTKTPPLLKSGTTYYIRVRAYKKVGKTKYCSKWCKVKKVKVR